MAHQYYVEEEDLPFYIVDPPVVYPPYKRELICKQCRFVKFEEEFPVCKKSKKNVCLRCSSLDL